MDEKIKRLMTEINDRAIREERVRNQVGCAVCLILLILYALSIGPLAWTIQGGVLSREAELLLTLGLFVFGIVAGLVSRWGPLSGWAALAFPTVLPPLGIGLTISFC